MIQQIRNLTIKTLRNFASNNQSNQTPNFLDFIDMLKAEGKKEGLLKNDIDTKHSNILSNIIKIMQRVFRVLLPKKIIEKYALLFDENMTRNIKTSSILKEKWSEFETDKVHNTVIQNLANIIIDFLSSTLDQDINNQGGEARKREIISKIKLHPELVVDAALMDEIYKIANLFNIKKEARTLANKPLEDTIIPQVPPNQMRDKISNLYTLDFLIQAIQKREQDYYIAVLGIKDIQSIQSKYGKEAREKILYVLARFLQNINGDENVSKSGENHFTILLFVTYQTLNEKINTIKTKIENNIFLYHDTQIKIELTINVLQRSKFAKISDIKNKIIELSK